MSLLGTQVFANPATPIWLSATNPVINGSLTVEGPALFQDTVTAEQTIVAESDIEFKATDDPAATNGRIVAGDLASGRLYIQGDTDIAFGKIGQPLVNTLLTLGTGGNADDVLDVAGTLNTIDFTSQTIATNSFSPVRGTATVAGIGAGNNAITFGGNLAGNVLQPNGLYMFGMTVNIADAGAGTAAQEIYATVRPTSVAQNLVSLRTYTSVEASPNFTLLSVTGYLRHTDVSPNALAGDIILGTGLTVASTITIIDPFLLRLD